MIVSFLYPFELRGLEAPFLWVYFNQRMSFKTSELTFLLDESYLNDKAYFLEKGRGEVESVFYDAYSCEGKEFPVVVLPQEKLNEIAKEYDDLLLLFKEYLTEVIPAFETLLFEALGEVVKETEVTAVLSWSNCPSLKSACDKLGLTVIYNEIGPFRMPVFQNTAFFDFSGVNGNTESIARYRSFTKEIEGKESCLLSYKELSQLLLKSHYSSYSSIGHVNEGVEYDIGLMLQVENDSNVIAFSNGYDNIKLIESEKNTNKVFARKHPAGLESYEGKVSLDTSPDSIAFIRKCKKIKTVNSGAAMEAALFKREIEVMGDSPYTLLSNLNPKTDEAAHLMAVNFLVLNYIIPFSLLCDTRYIKYRLTRPNELELFHYHLTRYQKEIIEEQKVKLIQEQEKLKKQEGEKLKIEAQLHEISVDYHGMNTSLSWRITKPLRSVKSVIVSPIKKVYLILKTLVYAPKEFSKLGSLILMKNELIGQQLSRIIASKSFVKDYPNIITAKILTTRHCLFIGELIKNELKESGIISEIMFEKPQSGFSKELHFVVCPQIFQELPDYYISYQLEQSVSSRWFDESYFEKLKNSVAVFDYSLMNLKYLQDNGLSLKDVFHVPIAYLPNYLEQYNLDACNEEQYDVLFYGDVNNPRREAYLAKISEKFKVKVVKEVFGLALYQELIKAKIILNIHYYEGALLETTRIYECLSLDRLIVSEESVDQREYQELHDIVDFVPIDDIQGMIDRIEYWLLNDSLRRQKVIDNKLALQSQSNRFRLGMNRFMLNEGMQGYSQYYERTNKDIDLAQFTCLSLVESTDRRALFDSVNEFGISVFNGLRKSKGWIGCGLSYKYMINKAKDLGYEYVILCEDDVAFNEGFEKDLETILAYLDQDKVEWDVFSGLISDMHEETKIHAVEVYEGKEFVHVDRFVGMVFNIYHRRIFNKIIEWDETLEDEKINTIDRYLESDHELKVITTAPFLVGHREDADSTLWEFNNSEYNSLIYNSTERLNEKIAEFKK